LAYHLTKKNSGPSLAMRFTLNVADTLKSVRIYFDPVAEEALIQASSFRIVVWNIIGGKPGTILYKDSVTYPKYVQGSHNIMSTYNLTSCLPLPVGSYFIGIQQTTNQEFYIGFDRNTNHSDALYYDIGNGWVQSAIPGSLMINPVMGCTYPEIVSVKELDSKNKFSIYPNPAQDKISIKYLGNQMEDISLDIYSSLGQLVQSNTIKSTETIDISNLVNGIYF